MGVPTRIVLAGAFAVNHWGFLTAVAIGIAAVIIVAAIGHYASLPCATVTTLTLPHDFQLSGHLPACVNVVIRDAGP